MRIYETVKERRGVTADTTERLARYFRGDAASCQALHADYDLKTLATRDDIARQVSPREAAPALFAKVAAGFAFFARAPGLCVQRSRLAVCRSAYGNDCPSESVSDRHRSCLIAIIADTNAATIDALPGRSEKRPRRAGIKRLKPLSRLSFRRRLYRHGR